MNPLETDHLTEGQFRRLLALVESHAGIRLHAAKRIMVESRLRRRVRALKMPSLAVYGAEVLEGEVPEGEFAPLIDCLTTNKTDFFREPVHFELLRDVIVPEAMRRPGSAPLKVWSAACSTGAEPYTVAMVLAECGIAFDVLGTDISTDVLAQARRGVYPAEMVEPVPAPLRRKYLMTARDAGRAEVRIVPELRAQVRFRHLNLMDAHYAVERDMDVILCRNVLIYFERAVQQAVVRRLCGHLRPGGFLLLGHSETMAGGGPDMHAVHPTVYQHRPARAQAA